MAHEQLLDHGGEYYTLHASQFHQQQAPLTPAPVTASSDGRLVAVPAGADSVQILQARQS